MPRAGPGRPPTQTRAKLDAVCFVIRSTGVSDTAAAALAGVARTTLSRWKEDEEILCEFDQARAQYTLPRLRVIEMTKTRDGELDWRAQAWLIKFANPEEYGPPSRRRKLKDVQLPPTPEEEQAAQEQLIAQGREEWSRYKRGGIVTVPMQHALIAMRQENMRQQDPAGYDAHVAARQSAKAKAQEEETIDWAEIIAARERALANMKAMPAPAPRAEPEPEKRDNSSRNSFSTGSPAAASTLPGNANLPIREDASTSHAPPPAGASAADEADEKRSISSRNSPATESAPSSPRRVGRREKRALARQARR